MTNRELYDAALHLASEVDVQNENTDYAERAPYLLAAICVGLAPLDRIFRSANRLPAQTFPTAFLLPLDSEFPLSDAFASPTAMGLAALLTMEENPELSDRLRKLASDAVSAIRASIPFSKESIADCYRTNK